MLTEKFSNQVISPATKLQIALALYGMKGDTNTEEPSNPCGRNIVCPPHFIETSSLFPLHPRLYSSRIDFTSVRFRRDAQSQFRRRQSLGGSPSGPRSFKFRRDTRFSYTIRRESKLDEDPAGLRDTRSHGGLGGTRASVGTVPE